MFKLETVLHHCCHFLCIPIYQKLCIGNYRLQLTQIIMFLLKVIQLLVVDLESHILSGMISVLQQESIGKSLEVLLMMVQLIKSLIKLLMVFVFT